MKKILVVIIGMFIIVSCTACDNIIADNNINSEKTITQTIRWENIYVNTILPKPNSSNWNILTNETDYLDINIFDTSLEDYKTYVVSCENKGFKISTYDDTGKEKYECEGYNKYHSKLHITYNAQRGTMNIRLSAIIENNPFEWSNSTLAQMLPIPELHKGYIDADNVEKYEVILIDVSSSYFNTYVVECKEKGFNLNPQSYSAYYQAENKNGYRVTIEYSENNCEMGITLIAPEEAE